MKKLLIILILFSGVANYLYGQTDPDSILGHWITDYQEMEMALEGEAKERYKQLDEQPRIRAEESLGYRNYIFHDGGKIISYWKFDGNKIKLEGTWKITEEDQLEININNQKYHYKLIFETRYKIVLIKEKITSQSLFDRLVLNRKQS